MSDFLKQLEEAVDAYIAAAPKRIRRQGIALKDEVTSAEVVVVSDDLSVVAKPARESTDGNQ